MRIAVDALGGDNAPHEIIAGALSAAEGLPRDIVLPRTHRTGYAHALAAAGARLVDVGHTDRGTGAGVRRMKRPTT